MPDAADDATPVAETRTARRLREEAERRARRRGPFGLHGPRQAPGATVASVDSARSTGAPSGASRPGASLAAGTSPYESPYGSLYGDVESPPALVLAAALEVGSEGSGRSAASATTPWVTVAGVAMLALLLAVSALGGQVETGVALAFCGLVLGWGWPLLLDSPTPGFSGLVVGAGAVALPLTAALTVDEDYLRWLPATLGVATIVAFLQQLLRRDRTGLTRGIAATLVSLAVASSGACLAALPAYRLGSSFVVVAAAALALAVLAETLERLGPLRRVVLLLAMVGGLVGALVAAPVVGGVAALWAVVTGLMVGAISHVTRRVLVVLPGASSPAARLGIAAASVLVVGVVVYLVARVAVA